MSDADMHQAQKQAQADRDAATLALAQGIWESIVETEMPRATLEVLGQNVVRQNPWDKLPSPLKLAIFRITMTLETKMAENMAAGADEGEGTENDIPTVTASQLREPGAVSRDEIPAEATPNTCKYPLGDGMVCGLKVGHKGKHFEQKKE